MYLIYINKVGTTYKGDHIFEFLFSKSTKWEWDESWYESSAIANKSELNPDSSVISEVGTLKTSLFDLELVQESGVFDVYNAVEGIIALGWEKLNDESDLDNDRLVFKFGDSKEEVNAKLYQYDLVLDYKKNKVTNKDE